MAMNWRSGDVRRRTTGTSRRTPATTVSKVDWRAADKVDPDFNNASPSSSFKLEDIDAEVKGTMEHEALMAKSRAKLNEFMDKATDLINEPPPKK